MPVLEPISSPKDLEIPERLNAVMESLNSEGRAKFIAEIIFALQEAEKTDDLARVQYVVSAWWVSRKFGMHPDIRAAIESAERDQGPALTIEEVAKLLGVAA